jgi:hypothetical protein
MRRKGDELEPVGDRVRALYNNNNNNNAGRAHKREDSYEL